MPLTLLRSLAQLPTESRDLILQQLSYLTACAKGLSDPEGDLVDLDASFDDSQQVKEGSARVVADERVQMMRRALGEAVEGAARVWSGDAEVVQVCLGVGRCAESSRGELIRSWRATGFV